jgi:large subunit ribosomal protein L9
VIEVDTLMSKSKAGKPAGTKPRQRRAGQLPRGPHGGVQLLLVQSVEHLGKQGDVVEVKLGYAVNYLLPQGLATVANEHHRRMVEKHKARLAEIPVVRLAGLRAMAESLGHQSLTIEAKANEEGHWYGSVGPADIANALKRVTLSVTPDQVRLQGPLKELGLYSVKIHLGHEVEGELKIWVVPSVGEEQPDEAV